MFHKLNRTNLNVFSAKVASAALLMAAVTLTSAPSYASTQGTLGATSQGSVQITVSIPSRVQISGLTDIAFTDVELGSQVSRAQNNCVWSNTATKGYTITATGSGTGGAFTLSSGQLAPITYGVQWAQTSGQTSGTALIPSAASAGFVSTALLPTCIAAPSSSSSLIVTVAASQLETMVSSTNYTGTLTLLVNPS
ncbi:hypothetical protein U1737_19420 [Sphingomonas sp. LB3N6]|uniref:hypothetical protein n=1 Tax=Sphingomonas fucosidasi TaxID=3096164 RepID=UPI002FCC2C48